MSPLPGDPFPMPLPSAPPPRTPPFRISFVLSIGRGFSKSAILLLEQYLKLYLQGAKRGWCVVKGTW